MRRTARWGCVTATALLLITGASFYALGSVGWAQSCWVLASGTTGAAVALFLDRS